MERRDQMQLKLMGHGACKQQDGFQDVDATHWCEEHGVDHEVTKWLKRDQVVKSASRAAFFRGLEKHERPRPIETVGLIRAGEKTSQ